MPKAPRALLLVRACLGAALALGLTACEGAARAPSPLSFATLPASPAPRPEVKEDPAAGAQPGDEPLPAPLPAPAPAASSAARVTCAPPDQGWGRYAAYVPIPGGKVSLPRLDAPSVDGGHDVFLHFHAYDAVRRGFVRGGFPMVFAGVSLGAGSKAYGAAFEDRARFEALRRSIEEAMRAGFGDPRAHIRRLVLSSWSAGFAASVRILKHNPARVDGLVLLDSLYAPYAVDARGRPRQGVIHEPALAGVLAFAREAALEKRFVFLSYSRTSTTGYASTEEVASYLLGKLGADPLPVSPGEDPRGPVSAADLGGVHVRGYRGSDAQAHCAHLRRVEEALALLAAQSR